MTDGMEFVVLAEHPRRATPVLGVTRAELAIAQAIARGHSSTQIARQRGTSRRTVEHQTGSLYRKLRVASRAELVRALRKLRCL